MTSLVYNEIEMTDTELETALEALDHMFQHMELFSEPPDETVEEDLRDFIDFMGFHPGTLHQCYVRYTWLVGPMEDPTWLGSRAARTDVDDFIRTEPDEPFLIIGTVLLRETYQRPGRDDTYAYYLKILVRDKVAYAPIPIDTMDENGANHFKSLFTQVVTER